MSSTPGHPSATHTDRPPLPPHCNTPMDGSAPVILQPVGSFVKRKLSETRGVNLASINLPQQQSEAPRKTPPLTASPLGNTLHHIDRSGSVGNKPRSGDTITVRIFLPEVEGEDDSELSGISLSVPNGRSASVAYLLQLAGRELQLSSTEPLALWMVSNALEVQLKPHHAPYEVRRGWRTLLGRFSCVDADADEAEDEPSLVLRASCSVPPSRLLKFADACPRTAALLCREARCNLLSGRLSVDSSLAARLVGCWLSCRGDYAQEKHSLEWLRREISSHLPAALASSLRGHLVFGRAVSKPTEGEQALIGEWRRARADTLSVSEAERQHELWLRYLRAVSESPTWGCAFFRGSIERPSGGAIREWRRILRSSNSPADQPVLLAISRESVCVLDTARCELLLVRPLRVCSWRRIDCSADELADGVEPVLLLHFPEQPPGEDDKLIGGSGRRLAAADSPPPNTQLLQVFGRQCVMMDALLTAMNELNEQGEGAVPAATPSIDLADSLTRGVTEAVPRGCPTPRPAVGRSPSLTKTNRMCLAVFCEGRLVKADGSLKKVDWSVLEQQHSERERVPVH